MTIDAATRQQVRERANGICEYCHIAESAVEFLPFHVEHIIAQQHKLDDSIDNLALACDRCNAYKGPNLSSIDPKTGAIVTLFHPRQDAWSDHFELNEGVVIGITPTGRATVKLLNMNARRRVQLRLGSSSEA